MRSFARRLVADYQKKAESVILVDDDTDRVSSRKPKDLVKKLQREVNNSVNWLKDNILCVAGDKSKLLKGGKEQVKRTRLKNTLAIFVDEISLRKHRIRNFWVSL